ncbi:MAG: hypothetical protein AB7O04_15530 [Hyphomonadaceae bacterium]
MTTPTFEQFHIGNRRAVHRPTGAVIEFPIAQPWTSNGFSLCDVGVGRADQDLPNGEHYRLQDVIEAARRLMLQRALAA